MAALRTFWQALRTRLRRRSDSEAKQAIIRVLLGTLACIYMLSADLGGSQAIAERVIAWDAFVFLVASVVILIGVLRSDETSPPRRAAGIFLDMSATSVAIAFGGEASAPLMAVYLWVIVGNGFRYGDRYLALAVAAALIGLSAAIVWSPFWREHILFSASLLLILVLIPAYMAALLRKLRSAMKEAAEANLAKSRFLAKMSHELRTPLNGVIGVADLLQVSELGARERELVSTIQASSGALLGLIDEILDFSRIEAGHIEISRKPFLIAELLSDTRAMLRRQADEKGLSLTCDTDPRIPEVLIGDLPHTRQVLLNLVSNGIKFTESGSVNVFARLAVHQPASTEVLVRFEVSDTGCGIAADEQDRVFESFHQASAHQEANPNGIGLGAAIAQELVERMEGRIGIRSELGEGSVFWFELPFGTVKAAGIAAQPQLSQMRALVAGSGEHVVSLLQQLKGSGLRPTLASSPTDAAEQAARAAGTGDPYRLLIVLEPDFDQGSLEGFGRVGKRMLRFLVRKVGSRGSTTPRGFNGVVQWPLNDDELLLAIRQWDEDRRPTGSNVISFAEYYRSVSSQRNSRLRILVAEDNETNRRVLQGILEQAGHQLTIVSDGEAALDALTDADFDLMILDKGMPRRTGLEVFKAHRFMRPTTSIPTIILSADATEGAIKSCLDAGVDAYLTKPVASYKLLSTVARVSHGEVAGPPQGAHGPTGDDSGATAPPAIDWAKLRELRTLDDESDALSFLEDLVADFRRDAEAALSEVAEALYRQDYPALRSALHALEGSAHELGTLGILSNLKQLRKLKPFELDSPRARDMLEQLRATVDTTSQLLSGYVAHANEERAL